MEMRLQRFLAQAGVASRRKAEELIVGGHVRVNGRVVTELGTKVDARKDEVAVDGRRVRAQEHVYVLLHKPRGYVTTLDDPEGRPTVMQLVRGLEARLYPVGRLDFNTEGVLLLTNDGDLANALMHPSREVEKTYHVKLRGVAMPEVLEGFRSGVTLDDGSRTAPARAVLLGQSEGGNNSWMEVTIHEGKNRQIHRMAEALGHQVAKLHRIRYAGLDVDDLRPGAWRVLHDDEVARLRKLAGLAAEKRRPGPRAPVGVPVRPGHAPAKGRPGARAEQPRPRADHPRDRAEHLRHGTHADHPRERADHPRQASRGDHPRERGDHPRQASRGDHPRPASRAERPSQGSRADHPRADHWGPGSRGDHPRQGPRGDHPRERGDHPWPASRAERPSQGSRADHPRDGADPSRQGRAGHPGPRARGDHPRPGPRADHPRGPRPAAGRRDRGRAR